MTFGQVTLFGTGGPARLCRSGGPARLYHSDGLIMRSKVCPERSLRDWREGNVRGSIL